MASADERAGVIRVQADRDVEIRESLKNNLVAGSSGPTQNRRHERLRVVRREVDGHAEIGQRLIELSLCPPHARPLDAADGVHRIDLRGPIVVGHGRIEVVESFERSAADDRQARIDRLQSHRLREVGDSASGLAAGDTSFGAANQRRAEIGIEFESSRIIGQRPFDIAEREEAVAALEQGLRKIGVDRESLTEIDDRQFPVADSGLGLASVNERGGIRRIERDHRVEIGNCPRVFFKERQRHAAMQ